MQTTGRHILSVFKFEDTKTPPPMQRVFPHRRHSSNLKTSKSSTPIDRRRQQTLTQIIPSLSHLSTSFGSFDGSDDLEFDTPHTMPPKRKSRRGSKLPAQKQTITQMDPFRLQHHSDEDHLHSDTEPPHPLPARKKRKSISTTPITSTVQTRSAKKKSEADARTAAEASPTRAGNQFSTAPTAGASDMPESQAQPMPPPKTPKTVRRKVIPSSQSPADTPISTCKRSGRKTLDVTALKERSVNTPSKSWAASRRKDVQWTPKLEVADSTDIENDDSQSVFPIVVQKYTKTISRTTTPQPRALQEESPLKLPSSLPFASYREQGLVNGSKEPATNPEDDATDLVSRNSQRANNDGASPSPTAASTRRIPQASTCKLSMSQLSEAVGPVGLSYNDDDEEHDSYETVPTQLLLQSKGSSKLPPNSIKVPRQIQDSFQSLTSEEPATRLAPEDPPSSSPLPSQRSPMLETESQFDNAWRDFTPPVEYDGDTPGNGEILARISDAHEPSLPLVNRRTNTGSSVDLQPLPMIPPSQATTVDQTQASVRHTQAQQTSARKTRQQVPSSPSQQRQALSSSSPFHTRKGRAADTYMGYQGWNGVPMTESQLLPDSLLDDNLGLPPMPDVGEDVQLELEEY
ncbi:MAG: hypothetical protein Q9168_006218 [Polycauliona sp. 1 TL-2023]